MDVYLDLVLADGTIQGVCFKRYRRREIDGVGTAPDGVLPVFDIGYSITVCHVEAGGDFAHVCTYGERVAIIYKIVLLVYGEFVVAPYHAIVHNGIIAL